MFTDPSGLIKTPPLTPWPSSPRPLVIGLVSVSIFILGKRI